MYIVVWTVFLILNEKLSHSLLSPYAAFWYLSVQVLNR